MAQKHGFHRLIPVYNSLSVRGPRKFFFYLPLHFFGLSTFLFDAPAVCHLLAN